MEKKKGWRNEEETKRRKVLKRWIFRQIDEGERKNKERGGEGEEHVVIKAGGVRGRGENGM